MKGRWGSPPHPSALMHAQAWEPVFMRWAGGGSSEEGQEGHKATTLTAPPPSSWEAVQGSWPGATATQPRANSGKS